MLKYPMNILLYFLVFLTDFLAAAHFLRVGNIPMTFLFGVLPFLMFAKNRWADRIVLLSLVVSFFVFLKTTYTVVMIRLKTGVDYHRFLLIMGIVLVLELVAAVLMFILKAKRCDNV